MTPIFDGEFNMDGAACWLENNKQEIMVYGQDNDSVKIKLNGEIISVYTPNLIKGKFFLKCGHQLNLISKEKHLKFNIKLEKSKTMECFADVALSSKNESKILKKLKFKCSY